MLQFAKSYALILPIFLALDAVWIGVLMHSFYDREMGELARRHNGQMSPRWGAAILVYLLIPAGLVFFVRPLLSPGTTMLKSIGFGMMFGLVIYGVYDLTNRAVIEHWSLRMTLVDMIWGTCLCGAISAVLRSLV